MATKRPNRKRPLLTVTVDADVKERLYVLASKVPGGTLSGVVGELLKTTLPMMEAAVQVLEDAKLPDGSIDRPAAEKGMAAWIGTQLLTMYDTRAMLGEGARDPA